MLPNVPTLATTGALLITLAAGNQVWVSDKFLNYLAGHVNSATRADKLTVPFQRPDPISLLDRRRR
jgi:hypothetical protein